MESREIIAYVLMLAIVVVVIGAWLYGTRERRAQRAMYRRSRKRRHHRASQG